MITGAGHIQRLGRPAQSRRPRRVLGCMPAGNAGISLLEILIAIVILSVVVLGATAFSFQSRWALDEEEHKRTAIQFTSSLLEDLRAQPVPINIPASATSVVDGTTYTVTFTKVTGYNPNVIRVDAKTQWATRTGTTRSFTTTTLLPNRSS